MRKRDLKLNLNQLIKVIDLTIMQPTPSVEEMAPPVTVDNNAEENLLRIAMGNNLFMVGRRED